MEIAKKGVGNVFIGFTNIKRFLIDHPAFQAQTGDLVEALHFLCQFWDDPQATLIDGFGPDTQELDWRDMMIRTHFDSTARH
jgi:hypothetical protein